MVSEFFIVATANRSCDKCPVFCCSSNVAFCAISAHFTQVFSRAGILNAKILPSLVKGSFLAHFRHPKLLEERLTLHGDYVVTDPEVCAGTWRSRMPGCKKLCVDVGCGKGLWTSSAAKAWDDCLFVGVDYELMCISFAAEQAAIGGVASSGWAKNTEEGFVAPSNVRFVCAPASDLGNLFADGEIDHLFLNYPTPFPKKKETANRIVNVDHLKVYERLLAPGGMLHFKTDSQPLFDYALDQLKLTQFDVVALTRDLHGDAPDAFGSFDDVDKLPSAYERKTLMRGAKIHALHAQLKAGSGEVRAACDSAQSTIDAPSAEPVSLYDYLPEDLDSITYVPLGMENALFNMRNRRTNGHGGVWGQQ